MKERRKEGKKERRKEGKKERRKEGKKERRTAEKNEEAKIDRKEVLNMKIPLNVLCCISLLKRLPAQTAADALQPNPFLTELRMSEAASCQLPRATPALGRHRWYQSSSLAEVAHPADHDVKTMRNRLCCAVGFQDDSSKVIENTLAMRIISRLLLFGGGNCHTCVTWGLPQAGVLLESPSLGNKPTCRPVWPLVAFALVLAQMGFPCLSSPNIVQHRNFMCEDS